MLQKTQSIYNIQFVSNVTGINPHTIRAWEKRYEAVTPLRDSKGRRIYSQLEIARLELLYKLVSSGNNISDIANLETERLEEMINLFSDKLNNTTSSQATKIKDIDIDKALYNLKLGLHGYKLDILAHELSKVVNNLNTRELALKVIAPFLKEMRELKQKNLLTEIQRDSIFALIKSYLGNLVYRETTDKNTAPVILAAPAGNLNELGLMMTALLCQNYNINYKFLGGHLSSETVGEISTQFNSKLVILGATFNLYQMSPNKFHDYVDSLLEFTDEKTNLWVIGVCSPDVQLQQKQVSCICNFEMLDDQLKSLTT